MHTQTFQSLGPLALAALLLPLGFGLWQDPVDKVDDGSDPPPVELPSNPDGLFFGPSEDIESNLPLVRRIQGCWKLTGVTAADYPKDGLDLLGYMLVTDHFMSLELQAFWDNTLEEAPNDALENFTAEYRITKEGFLEARILMGSYIDRDKGSLEWYKSERPRRFIVTPLGNDGLQLEWKDQNVMTFVRNAPSTQASRDFFGGLDAGLSNAEAFYDDSDVLEDPTPIGPDDEPDDEPDPDDER